MKKKRVTGRIRYKSAAKKLKKAVAVLMAALMMGSAVDYTAFPAVCAAEDVTGEQVAELTQDGKTTVYSSFMEAYQAITTSDKATIKLLQDSRISKITGSKYITYITDKEHTIVLDLNGHTLSTEEVSGWDSKESTYVLDIDTSSNWTICSGVPGGKIQDSGSKAALLENYGTLAIGGNVEITSNSEYTVFARGGTGNLSIDGAAIDKVGVMYGSCKITSGNIDNVFWRGGKAEISGGKIDTVSVIGDYAGWSKGSNLQLCGGTIGLLKQREEYTKAMSTWFAAGTAIKSIEGGSYSDVRSLKGNLRSMLENGYGFRSGEEGTAWIVDSDLLDGEGTGEDTAKIVSNVTVEKLPVTITQPGSYEDYCGNPASLYVNVDAAEEVTYQWYRITGEGNAEEISDATSNTLQISPLEFQPGVGITFYCMIYWQGYSIKSEEATVTLKEKIDFYINTAIEKYYTGEAVTLQEDEISLYLKDGSVNNTLVPGKDFKIVEGSHEHNTDATTQDKMASVMVEGIGKYKGTVQVRFSILQAENEFTRELTCKDYVYDGVAVPNPEAAAKFGTVKYRYAASETGEYTDVVPKSAGIYYVKAYVTETNNYTGLESRKAAKFVVFKAKQPENTPKDSITTPYTVKKVSQVELPADWQWVEEDASKDLPETESVEAKADYAGQDKDLYITRQVTITITRSACEHPDTKVKGEEASTCTTAGYTGDTYCEQCGRKIKEGKEIALLPHILEKIEKKNATTVKEGNIEYYHCSVCDGCFSDSEGTSPITKESTVIPVIKVTPTVTPSVIPTAAPSAKPTTEPGVEPTETPGAEPGVKPTAVPSAEPGVEPTAGPSAEPGAEPTKTPGAGPTAKPTAGSTAEPGGKPTAGPSVEPAAEPTVTPSAALTETPAGEPAIPKPTKKPVVKPAKKGKKLTGSKGAIYKVTSDKKGSPTVEYSAAAKGAKGTITIPAQVTIKGVTYKVTSVGASACRNRAGITKVIIGKNVTKIGNRVFSGCKKLKKVIIKTTKLTESTVGSNAFSGISSGVVVKVPESKVKAYRKLFKKKGISDGATITK